MSKFDPRRGSTNPIEPRLLVIVCPDNALSLAPRTLSNVTMSMQFQPSQNLDVRLLVYIKLAYFCFAQHAEKVFQRYKNVRINGWPFYWFVKQQSRLRKLKSGYEHKPYSLIRTKRLGRAFVCESIDLLTQGTISKRTTNIGLGIARGEPDYFGEFRDGLLVFSLFEMGQSAVIAGR